MKKLPVTIALSSTILTVLAVFALAPKTTPSTSMTPLPSTLPSPTRSPTPPALPNSNPGLYLAYDAQTVASTRGTKILFFHAPWCPQCRALDVDIKAGEIPSDVTIFKVDYDSNQALRQQYGVTIQTTLVKLADDGSFLEKYVAYNEPRLSAVERDLLK